MGDSLRDLARLARAWMADDPDPVTRAETAAMLDDERALAAHFGADLTFGTAGLRGLLGPGPARMNRRVVARTTRGLCDYLAQHVPDARERGLCVARDARHGSEAFAREVTEVALGAGFRVHLLEGPVPTPLLAFAVPHLGAAGGVMVTASHNPPAYNGYKVYFDNGAQIIPPHDRGIADAIARVGQVRELARVDATTGIAQGRLAHCEAALEGAYLASLRALLGRRDGQTLRVAYTPLHGVGARLALRALGDAGIDDVHVVPAQAEPDPDFPTVAFPNPEEPGTVDALMALAEKVNAQLAIANDPDADRLCLCARDGRGAFRMLSGNDVGALLTDYALTRFAGAVRAAGHTPLVCSTIVSTPMLAPIAEAHGARAELCLTGFKWMCNRALALAPDGYRCVFAFEDAMGYALGERVRDKDGIAAAVLAAQLAGECALRGQTLFDRLDELFARHGHHLSAQHSVSVTGVAAQQELATRMALLRSAPPTRIGPHAVEAFEDLLPGTGPLPSSDALILHLAEAQRVCIRPSGTEPKLKLYFDIRTDPRAGEPLAETALRARARMDALLHATVQALGLQQAPQG